MASNICTKCENKITGLKYTYNGKSYCYSCYQAIQLELAKAEQDKQELYSYIKQLFAISEIPEDILMGIDREINSGKKVKGIQKTLKYYYEKLEHTADDVALIVFVIKNQYENARQDAYNTNLQNQKNLQILREKPVSDVIDISRVSAGSIGVPSRRKKIEYDAKDIDK